MRRDYQLLAPHAVGRVSAEQRLPEHAPRGLEGGGDGTPAAIRIKDAPDAEWRDLPFGVTSFELVEGGVVSLTAAGGGGFGQPADGSPNETSRDGASGPRPGGQRIGSGSAGPST